MNCRMLHETGAETSKAAERDRIAREVLADLKRQDESASAKKGEAAEDRKKKDAETSKAAECDRIACEVSADLKRQDESASAKKGEATENRKEKDVETSKSEERDRIAREVLADLKKQDESASVKKGEAAENHKKKNDRWRDDLHGLLMGGTAFKLVMGIIGLFVGLYVMSGLLSLVRLMADGSLLVRCLAGAFFVVAVGGVAFCAFQTWKLLRRLPSIEQVIRADVAKLRAGDAKLSDEELGRVCDYVAAYSSDEREQSNELSERIGRLKNMVRKEDGAHAVKDSAEFVKKFIEFQDEQRKMADGIVRRSWKATGVATAGCPWKAGDMLIVLCNTVLMTCAIARVYGRKMDSSQALRYVFRWIGNLYLAGQMQDLMKVVLEMLKGVLPSDCISGIAAALPSIGGKMLGKLGEGAANALLLYLLGQQAIRSFEALREPQS